MAMDVLDMLTVLPVDQIEGPGIRWVKRQFKERCRENGVAYIRSRRARGEQRETIRLPGAVELSTESEDSSSDEEDMEMQDSDADKRPRPMRPKTLRV
ncbi:hypothetical protein F441_20784 [Phytophthora nicotianae CJ01A1]|uniref:Uncharacterized protein n=5 Tax=Phytophthora nicotianae TaxID=4792 RepID=W2PHM6_PHYN3|nr:hypothetical protein PPTG_24301 [Phytophthora nicotianae INRA-310]ETL26028.1 hypothetical protein L916_20202 [Phytophthora nicotianae]ETO60942.1 hypothetical protein F444_20937 [Phytophthora nicotianae P1976]ETP02069.1 hypothetical protein F441_20784 [Phytophthora nicotianae CJ01A1]ETP30229.1 hypothetical protein F442_20719 [Phytophthora nicotianae P10297]ETL79239.1 hypothetical protein L917_20076 [Phytophthora nicotianae]